MRVPRARRRQGSKFKSRWTRLSCKRHQEREVKEVEIKLQNARSGKAKKADVLRSEKGDSWQCQMPLRVKQRLENLPRVEQHRDTMALLVQYLDLNQGHLLVKILIKVYQHYVSVVTNYHTFTNKTKFYYVKGLWKHRDLISISWAKIKELAFLDAIGKISLFAYSGF